MGALRPANPLLRRMRPDSHLGMGDVGKPAFFVETVLQAFSCRMAADDHGQPILWRETRPKGAERSMEWVARAPFEEVVLEPERHAPLAAILGESRRDLRQAGAAPRDAPLVAAGNAAPEGAAPVRVAEATTS